MILSPAFVLALAANILFWTSLQSLFPVLPLYIAALGGTPADNGLFTLAAAGAAVLSRPWIGTLADHKRRKPILLIGSIIAATSPLLYITLQSIPPLLLVSALRGIAIAAFSTGFQVLLADLTPPERRGEAFGWGGNSGAVASLVGPVTGAWLLTRGGFTLGFELAAACGALCVLAVLLIREPARVPLAASSASPLRGWRETLALRNVRMSIAAVSPLGIAFGTTVTFWPLVAQQNHLNTGGAFYSVYALGLLLVQIMAGRLSDRIGRTRVMLPGMALAGLAFAAIPFASTDAASLLVAFACGAGLGIARTAIDALALDGVPPALRGTAVSIEFTINDVWIGLGSVLMGALAGWGGYGLAFALAGASCIALVGVLLTMGRFASTKQPET